MHSEVLELTCELVRRVSITPEDAGCQELIAARLQAAGFSARQLPFGRVKNLWLTHGKGAPVLCFLGHTDVVPPGPRTEWSHDPFAPEVVDGKLYGRGTADMKGSVAAMVLALEAFVREFPDHPGTIALLLTSDEEGPAMDGVRAVAEEFRRTGQKIDYCLVGEPSGRERLGDTLRIGRRGSLTGTLVIHGIQGHVAYPHLADNAVHRGLPILTAWAQQHWDDGSPDFPPTSFQIANLAAGTLAANIIPGQLRVRFNFRHAPVSSAQHLKQKIESDLQAAGLRYSLDWHDSGAPFLTPEGRLRQVVRASVQAITGLVPEENTAGGTSDGRFIAPLGAEVVEVGPLNASIHKVDEYVPVSELEQLPALYLDIARRILQG